MITDKTSIYEKVTKEEFGNYFGIPLNELYQPGEPEKIFYFYQDDENTIVLNYSGELIFETLRSKYDNAYVDYERCPRDKDIQKYFGLPYRRLNDGEWHTCKRYRAAKKLLCPLIKFIMRYKTLDVTRVLFDELRKSQKLNNLLTGGICMVHNHIPNELIVDVSSKF